MNPDLWLYFLAVLAVILLPGMDMAYVLASSVAAGTRGAVSAVLGMASGGLIHVIAAATGIAALMVVFPQLFHVLLLAGTLYLLYIGWGLIRRAGSAGSTSTQDPAMVESGGAIYRRALATCLLNPKAYAFTFAVFPAFVRSDTRSLIAQTAALCLITAGTQIVVYGTVAALAVRSRRFIQSQQKALARAMGAMLIAAAVATATQAWSAPAIVSTTNPEQKMTHPTPTSPFAGEKSGRDDFDFLVGDWQTVQKRMQKPLQPDSPWETFHATIHMEKLPGNLGNVDAMLAPDWRPNWTGVTLRVFNGETGLWSIYWMAGKTGGIDSATGQLAVPVVGKFINGVGIFECDEVIDGIALRTRYTWTRVDADNVKWQQAFSFDGGMTWKPNWHMTGKRIRKNS